MILVKRNKGDGRRWSRDMLSWSRRTFRLYGPSGSTTVQGLLAERRASLTVTDFPNDREEVVWQQQTFQTIAKRERKRELFVSTCQPGVHGGQSPTPQTERDFCSRLFVHPSSVAFFFIPFRTWVSNKLLFFHRTAECLTESKKGYGWGYGVDGKNGDDKEREQRDKLVVELGGGWSKGRCYCLGRHASKPEQKGTWTCKGKNNKGKQGLRYRSCILTHTPLT